MKKSIKIENHYEKKSLKTTIAHFFEKRSFEARSPKPITATNFDPIAQVRSLLPGPGIFR